MYTKDKKDLPFIDDDFVLDVIEEKENINNNPRKEKNKQM